MGENKTKNRALPTLRILLPIACGLWVGFIFSNSLRVGEQSSVQSGSVVELVQAVAQWIAPSSKIATATGTDYDWLHRVVRKLAHFTEFGVLGGLLCGCFFVYTRNFKKIWIPLLGVIFVPAIDETLQLFVSGRAGSITDFLIDLVGGITGFAVIFGVVLLAIFMAKKRRKRKEEKINNRDKEVNYAGTELGNCADQVQQENLV